MSTPESTGIVRVRVRRVRFRRVRVRVRRVRFRRVRVRVRRVRVRVRV